MRRTLLAAMLFTTGSVFLVAQDAAQIEAGRKVFGEKKCSQCHQAEGRGNKMYPLAGVAAKMSDADLRLWLTSPAQMEAKLKQQPKLKMSTKRQPLTENDVNVLLAYIKSLK
jgi:mono/diheme cytochrome c family protein